MSNEQPQNVVQATGRVAEGIVGGLSAQPGLLLIVVLNVAMFVMIGLLVYRSSEMRMAANAEIAELLRLCIMETKEMEDGP